MKVANNVDALLYILKIYNGEEIPVVQVASSYQNTVFTTLLKNKGYMYNEKKCQFIMLMNTVSREDYELTRLMSEFVFSLKTTVKKDPHESFELAFGEDYCLVAEFLALCFLEADAASVSCLGIDSPWGNLERLFILSVRLK